MSRFMYDDALQWADEVTATDEVKTSDAFYVGKKSGLCAVMHASDATNSGDFYLLIENSDAEDGTFVRVAAEKWTAPTSGDFSIKMDFTAYQPWIRAKILCGDGTSGTIKYSGWFGESTASTVYGQWLDEDIY